MLSDDCLEIASQGYSVSVALTGAELRSYQNSETGRELIWQRDPAYWSGSAPVLFPIVGRLKEDRYELDGKHYEMGGHGIVRKRVFNVLRHEPAELELRFRADDQSLQSYPFQFDLHVTFRLQGARLLVDYCVHNKDTRLMPFTIGSHPAFALRAGSAFSEYSIEFSEPETLDLYRLDGTLIGTAVQRNFLQARRALALRNDMFDNDALIFKNIRSQNISIINNSTSERLVTVDTRGAPHLGIWSKPNASYLCIEPWHGHSDEVTATGNLRDKPNMKWLDPAYTYDAGYGISWGQVLQNHT